MYVQSPFSNQMIHKKQPKLVTIVYQNQTHMMDLVQFMLLQFFVDKIKNTFHSLPAYFILYFSDNLGNNELIHENNWDKIRFLQSDGKKVEIKQQNLQNLHKTAHFDIKCDICKANPIYGIRYNCKICQNYNLCQKCEPTKTHKHPFYKFKLQVNNTELVPVQVMPMFGAPIPQPKVQQQKASQHTNNGQGPYVTHDIGCEKCKQNPIIGIRFDCTECRQSLCEKCHNKNQHIHPQFFKFEYVGHAAKVHIKKGYHNNYVNITKVKGNQEYGFFG